MKNVWSCAKNVIFQKQQEEDNRGHLYTRVFCCDLDVTVVLISHYICGSPCFKQRRDRFRVERRVVFRSSSSRFPSVPWGAQTVKEVTH